MGAKRHNPLRLAEGTRRKARRALATGTYRRRDITIQAAVNGSTLAWLKDDPDAYYLASDGRPAGIGMVPMDYDY
jgi:hypothetical protein